MARNKIAKKAIREDLSGVDFTFEDGSALAMELSALAPEIVQQLALHGISQKVGDSWSGETEIAVAKGKAQAVIDRLLAGDWKAVREGGGGGRITDLAQALANITGKTLEEAVGAVEALDKDQKSKLRKHAQINAEVKRIAAERAAAKVSGDDQVDLASLL